MTNDERSPTAADLSTTYLGLALRTPLVASPGPLTGRLTSLHQLQEAGIAAVVLPSLFEEQVAHDELEAFELFERGAGSNPEASSYFPDLPDHRSIGDRYLQHVSDAKDLLSIPVIGSLNGTTPGGWVTYAQQIADAGADALELNIYDLAVDVDATAQSVESTQLKLVAQVRKRLSIPLAVKVGPHYTAFGDVARRFVDAGADGLVLFNRMYQPAIDPVRLEVGPTLALSDPSELRLRLRWTALLRGRLEASLAVTGGVHAAMDVARSLLAGADVAMMTSALLRHGPGLVSTIEADLVGWMAEMEYASVSQLRGSMSHGNVPDPAAWERANYIDTLVTWANSFNEGASIG